MTTSFPFSNFTIRLSNIHLPIDIKGWTNFFEEDFSNVQILSKGQADLQFSLCDVYKVEFDAPIIIKSVSSFSTVPFTAILFLSDELFYLLLQIGEGNYLANTTSMALKGAKKNFINSVVEDS